MHVILVLTFSVVLLALVCCRSMTSFRRSCSARFTLVAPVKLCRLRCSSYHHWNSLDDPHTYLLRSFPPTLYSHTYTKAMSYYCGFLTPIKRNIRCVISIACWSENSGRFAW